MRYKLSEIKSKAVTKEDAEKVRAIEWHLGGKTADAPVLKTKIIPHIIRGRCVWFSWEDEQLKKLFNEGHSDKEIALLMNITESSASKRRSKMALLRKRNLDHCDIAKKIKLMINDNCSVKDVTETLKISVSVLYTICHEYGLSFRKFGSDCAISVVSKLHRAAICQLHDLGFKPEIMSLAFPYSKRTIYGVLYATPSSETVDLKSVPEAMKLLKGEIKKPGSRINPAECLIMETEGFDAFVTATGRSVDSTLNNFIHKTNRYDYYKQLANNLRGVIA